jgi:hypothetical protein
MKNLQFRRKLEASFLRQSLSRDLQRLLAGADLSIFDETLIVNARSREHLYAMNRDFYLFEQDDRLSASSPCNLGDFYPKIKKVRLVYGDRVLVLPLNLELRGLKMPLTSFVEVTSEEQVLAELRRHTSEFGLSGSFTRMRDNRPYLFSDGIEMSSGVCKQEMISVTNNGIYFPSDELCRFSGAILDAQGKLARINYKARRVSDGVMCERQVEARLVSFCGELWRLVKLVAPPRAMV